MPALPHRQAASSIGLKLTRTPVECTASLLILVWACRRMRVRLVGMLIMGL
jgi:hypothetical protein